MLGSTPWSRNHCRSSRSRKTPLRCGLGCCFGRNEGGRDAHFRKLLPSLWMRSLMCQPCIRKVSKSSVSRFSVANWALRVVGRNPWARMKSMTLRFLFLTARIHGFMKCPRIVTCPVPCVRQLLEFLPDHRDSDLVARRNCCIDKLLHRLLLRDLYPVEAEDAAGTPLKPPRSRPSRG